MKKIKKKNYKKIGILGGTFDPPHIGHLNISNLGLKKFKLDKIIWLITKKNPLKDKPYLSIKVRIKLSKYINRNQKKTVIKHLDEVIKAMRMPKDTDKEKNHRNIEMQKGYQSATLVPLKTVENCRDALDICLEISEIMDDSMASDVGSGALMANAGAISAAYNVRINLKSINDENFSLQTKEKLEQLLHDCANILNKVTDNVENCF